MATFLHNVALPLFTVVEQGASRRICRTLTESNVAFRRALVLCGPGRTRRLAGRIARSLERGGLCTEVQPIEAASFREVDRVKKDVIESLFPDVILGVGGGSVIDVTKLAAAERRLPWISIPTSASNDGFCSPVAVLHSDRGKKSVGASMPIGVIADLTVLMKTPRRLLLAGVGDLLSNLTAVADWELAAARGKASVNNVARMLALAGPRQVLAAENPTLDDPEFLRLIVEGLVLSGLAMEVSGTSRPCSGAEHLISHALDAAAVGHGLHGEQVALATAFCLRLHELDTRPFERLVKKLGMPGTPARLDISRDAFLDAVSRGPEMRPGRWTILNVRLKRDSAEEVYNASFGKRR